jgi:predicted nucleic acid-binding protein
MRVLLDTNVVLDVLLQREPWMAEAARVWSASVDGRVILCLSASTLTDVFYISRRIVGADRVRAVVRACLDSLEILPVDVRVAEHAYGLGTADFEDAVQAAVAEIAQVDVIATRDLGGFVNCTVEVLSPAELLLRLERDGGRNPALEEGH